MHCVWSNVTCWQLINTDIKSVRINGSYRFLFQVPFTPLHVSIAESVILSSRQLLHGVKRRSPDGSIQTQFSRGLSVASNSNQPLFNARVMPSDKLMERVEERERERGWGLICKERMGALVGQIWCWLWLWTASPGPSFKPLGLVCSCLVSSHSQRKDWFLWEGTQITSIWTRGALGLRGYCLLIFTHFCVFLFLLKKDQKRKRKSWGEKL